MNELKVVIVMTLRQFSITPAYEELDRRRTVSGLNTVNGEQVYTVGIGEPVGKPPCRIEKVHQADRGLTAHRDLSMIHISS